MLLVIIILAIVLMVFFKIIIRKHVGYSKDTLMSLEDWYKKAEREKSRARLNMSKHLIIEAARMLDKHNVISDTEFAKLISVKDINYSNFIIGILAESNGPAIESDYSTILDDISRPAREYFFICITAIIRSQSIGYFRLQEVVRKSCGADIKW